MNFGIFIQQDSRVSEDLNKEKGPQFYLETAKLAEELGFDSFWYADHWMLPKNRATFDCWSMLAALAAATGRIKLGSLVSPITAYSPLALAKRVLTVQMISKGRVIFGVGTGYYKEEYEAFGVRFSNHKQRIEMLREALTLIKRVWRSDKPVNYEGRNYSTKGSVLFPRVARPPFWLGGSSDAILEIFADLGEGWIPYEISRVEYEKKNRKLHSIMDAAGWRKRNLKIAYASRVVAKKAEQEAADLIRNLGITNDYDSPTGQRGHVIVGSYDQCVEELGRYVEAGAEYLVLSPQPNSNAYELLPTLKDEIVSKL